MAGNGGFKSALNGFDRNEVNEYIGEMSKKIQEREAELRNMEAKATAAAKSAAEAEATVKSLQESHAAKVLELETQIKNERRNSDNFQNEIDELKRKLRNAANSSVNTAEAERRAAEIVENANAAARDIMEKAKRTAQQIIANAESAGAAKSGSGVSAGFFAVFSDILGELTGTITDALKAANNRASAISVSAGGSSVRDEVPVFSNIMAPQAAVPAGHAAKPVSKAVENVDDVFADMMEDGGDMADFGDFKPIDSAKNSRDSIDAFDLSGMDEMHSDPVHAKEEQSGFSMDDLFAQDSSGNGFDDMFGSGSEDLFADNPSDNSSDYDMGSAESGVDAMNALLGQMGAVLESAGGSSDGLDLGITSEPESNSFESDNPWADFQNEIKAMEQAGNFGSIPEDDIFAADTADDPKAPDADDSSIWNFDDMSSGGDDDMSSDLFGSF